MAASYEARLYGVRSAMGGGRARRLCPGACVVPPRWDAYVAASDEIFAILRRLFGVVERASMEEAFVDASGLEAGGRGPRARPRPGGGGRGGGGLPGGGRGPEGGGQAPGGPGQPPRPPGGRPGGA